MKTNRLITPKSCGTFVCAALVLSLSSQLAHAGCPEQNLEGTYKTERGDRFRIEQPDCSRAIVTDLQQKKKFEIQMNGESNNLYKSTLAYKPDLSPVAGPVTYTVDKSQWTGNVTTLKMRTKLKLGDANYQEGYESPTIRLDLEVQRLRLRDEDKVWGIWLEAMNLRAIAGRGSSPLQKAFVKGINLGIKLVQQIRSEKNLYSEYLERVN